MSGIVCRRMHKKLLWMVLISLLWVAAGADELSGPGRQTLHWESWGTVDYNPLNIPGDFAVDHGEGALKVTTAKGAVEVEDRPTSVVLTDPDHTLTVEEKPDGLYVKAGEAKYSFVNEGKRFVLTGPKARVVYERTPTGLTIDGPDGKVTIVQEQGDYTVTSPVGVSTYDPNLGGFEFTGPRLKEHPYSSFSRALS